jgi:hypothetical protein
MNYIPLSDLKNAWVFKHQSLPISDKNKAKIKPMTSERSAVLWDSFISKQADHPDFFKQGDWPFDKNTWQLTDNWEKKWDSEDPALPDGITQKIDWDNNTVIYFCCSRKLVIETTWLVFQECWKNFLFMDDGPILIGKKRKEALQFLSNGNYKLGEK